MLRNLRATMATLCFFIWRTAEATWGLIRRAAHATRHGVGRIWRAARHGERRIRPHVRRIQVLNVYCQVTLALLTVHETIRMSLDPTYEPLIRRIIEYLLHLFKIF